MFKKTCEQFDYLLAKKVAEFQGNLSRMLGNFDLESYGQTSVKVALVKFGLVFMKLKQLKCLHRENKNIDLHKTQVFSLLKTFPIPWGKN